ncbi:MAG: hypothetical protein ABW321_17145 [Polyangiales bacterium]
MKPTLFATYVIALPLWASAACESSDELPSHDAESTVELEAGRGESVGGDGPVAAGAGGGGSAAAGAGEDAAGAADSGSEPFGPGVETFAWGTDDFTVEPGEEKYLCFAKTLEEDLVASGYTTQGGRKQPFVHHLIFAKVNKPEPEGFAECDVAFRNSWETLFISGAGETTLEFPSDAGHQLKSGTQLLVQMHLLNSGTERVTGQVAINLRKSQVESPRPVSSAVFGTAAVELPPSSESQVVGTCTARRNTKLIAGFPHMHTLGKSLRFEVGAAEAELKEVFKREPYDFDDQRIENLEVEIPQGATTRVTCTYENTHAQTITYGESTTNEMCFFVGFAVDSERGGGCLEVLPPLDGLN